MKDVITFIDIPTFGSNSTKVAPQTTQYSNGYISDERLPAEHENYFLAGLTGNGNSEQAAINNILLELKNLLALRSTSPNPSVNNQIAVCVSSLISAAVATETGNRTLADSTLQNNINSEASTRQTNDGTLQTNINNLSAIVPHSNYYLTSGDIINQISASGIYSITPGVTNMPETSAYWTGFVTIYNDGSGTTKGVFIYNHSNSNMYYSTETNGVWHPGWIRIATHYDINSLQGNINTETTNRQNADAQRSRTATIVIASSNSSAASQAAADYVITYGEDASETINSCIISLNSAVGGDIHVCEGWYALTGQINLLSNVNIYGAGLSTMLYRSSTTLTQMIYIAETVNDCTLKDFYLNGNKSVVGSVSGNAYGIYCQANTNLNINYYNVVSSNHQGTGFVAGFYNIINPIGCRSLYNLSASYFTTATGFAYCKKPINCISNYHATGGKGAYGASGFFYCTYGINCSANYNSSSYDSALSAGYWYCDYFLFSEGNYNGTVYSGTLGYGFYHCTNTQYIGTGNKTALSI